MKAFFQKKTVIQIGNKKCKKPASNVLSNTISCKLTVNAETKDLFELKVGNYIIKREALVALRTNGWLHGDTIEGFMTIISTKTNLFIPPTTTLDIIRPEKNGKKKSFFRKQFDLTKFYTIAGLYNPNGVHWCLFFVTLGKTPSVSYIDPLGKNSALTLEFAQNWNSFWKDKVNDTDFKIKSLEQNNQRNGYDCGTYVCKYYEDLLANKKELRFSEKELPEFRKKLS